MREGGRRRKETIGWASAAMVGFDACTLLPAEQRAVFL